MLYPKLESCGGRCSADMERDYQNAVLHDMACELPVLAGRLASIKEEAVAWLSLPEYDALRLRLEVAHPAAEATAVEDKRTLRLNDGRKRSEQYQDLATSLAARVSRQLEGTLSRIEEAWEQSLSSSQVSQAILVCT